MTIETEDDVAALKRIGRIVSSVLHDMLDAAEPGMTTRELDALEPFLSTRSRSVTEAADGWTLVGAPGNLSAQYEHTMIITRGEPIVVTLH